MGDEDELFQWLGKELGHPSTIKPEEQVGPPELPPVPALALLPADQETSLMGRRVRWTEPSWVQPGFVAVSEIDAAGRVLIRAERDWHLKRIEPLRARDFKPKDVLLDAKHLLVERWVATPEEAPNSWLDRLVEPGQPGLYPLVPAREALPLTGRRVLVQDPDGIADDMVAVSEPHDTHGGIQVTVVSAQEHAVMGVTSELHASCRRVFVERVWVIP